MTAVRAWARVANSPRATSSASSRSRTTRLLDARQPDRPQRSGGGHGLRRQPEVLQQPRAVAVRHERVRQPETNHLHTPGDLLEHRAAEPSGKSVLLYG